MKQADVVLLGYPVPFPLSPRVRRNNLEVYEAVTSPRGPAMTWVRWAAVLTAARPGPARLRLPSPCSGPHSACPLTSDPRACLLWAGWS